MSVARILVKSQIKKNRAPHVNCLRNSNYFNEPKCSTNYCAHTRTHRHSYCNLTFATQLCAIYYYYYFARTKKRKKKQVKLKVCCTHLPCSDWSCAHVAVSSNPRRMKRRKKNEIKIIYIELHTKLNLVATTETSTELMPSKYR